MSETIERADPKSLANPRDRLVDSVASPCDEDHLIRCPCHNELLDRRYAELKSKAMKELKDAPGGKDNAVLQGRLYRLKMQALKDTAAGLAKKGVRCPIERAQLDEELATFDQELDGKYDLSDPRVRVIVRELLCAHVTIIRAQHESRKRGIVFTAEDNLGNEKVYLNPVEELKRKYSETRIKAILALDKMLEGDKHQIVSKTEKVDPGELWGDPAPDEGRVIDARAIEEPEDE